MQKLLQSLPRSKRDSDRESEHTTRLHVSCSCLMPMDHVSCLMLMLMPMHHVLCSCPCITSHVSCSCFILRFHGRHSWSHGRNANAVSQFSGSILVLPEGILKGNSLHGAPTLPCLRCFFILRACKRCSVHVHLSSLTLRAHAIQVKGCKRLRPPDSDDDGGGDARPDCHDCLSSFWPACVFHVHHTCYTYHGAC